MSIRLELVDSFRIDEATDRKIRMLLDACFPGWSHHRIRSYLKQLPSRRLLTWDDDALVGQAGLEHRVVALDGAPATIFGIVDLCVVAEQRGRGIATRMLDRIEGLGREQGVEFMLLFADDDRLYRACGYAKRPARVRWLKIHEHESIGLGEESVDELMVKALGDRDWSPTCVDLLGHLF